MGQWICFSLLSCNFGKKRWGRGLIFWQIGKLFLGNRFNSVARIVFAGRKNSNWGHMAGFFWSIRVFDKRSGARRYIISRRNVGGSSKFARLGKIIVDGSSSDGRRRNGVRQNIICGKLDGRDNRGDAGILFFIGSGVKSLCISRETSCSVGAKIGRERKIHSLRFPPQFV